MGGTNPIMKSTDTQNVTVHVRAIQQMPGGDTDQMETTSSGILRTHGNRRYLFYSEKAEDGSETRTVMKFDQRSAQLTRNGQISSVFVFDEKQHCGLCIRRKAALPFQLHGTAHIVSCRY